MGVATTDNLNLISDKGLLLAKAKVALRGEKLLLSE